MNGLSDEQMQLLMEYLAAVAYCKFVMGRRNIKYIRSAMEAAKPMVAVDLIYCSDCGDLYRRTQWYLKGEHVPVWRCVSRLEKRKSGIDCPSRTLYETDLHAAVITAFNQMIEQKDEFLPGMRLAMGRALAQNNSPRVAEIDARSEELQKELLKKANAKQGFEELADEIDALREEKQALLLEDANRTAMKQRLDELEAFLDERQEPVTDYDEGMVRRLIERITVYDDHLAFEFKCGLETEVQK